MLSFKSNRLTSIAEDSLSPSLGWLILTDNKLQSLPPSVGRRCPGLRKLMLAANDLTSLPASLSHCHQLELLRISGNKLTSIPHWLFLLPKLSWLALAGNPACESKTTSQLREWNLVRVIDWSNITISDKIGEGASGIVYRGVWNGVYSGEGSERLTLHKRDHLVAVKLFKGEATSDGLPEDEMRAVESIGNHPNSIQVYGRMIHVPEGRQGLVLALIPEEYETLGNPPSFTSVTRDTFRDDQSFSVQHAVKILEGVSSLAAHLHEKRINHGDLYAHNILVHRETGFPLLGDFGAATLYSALEEDGNLLEAVEVRAFGCLIEDLIIRTRFGASSSGIEDYLCDLMRTCLDDDAGSRPSFSSLHTLLESLLTHPSINN